MSRLDGPGAAGSPGTRSGAGTSGEAGTPGQVDVVVIGAGPAGEVVAGRCADAGLTVAVVERERVGGECSFWGCIPSKTLIRPGELLAAARATPGAAAAVTGGADAAGAFARRDEMVGDYSDEGQVPWLREKGIQLVRGVGRLVGERRVAVRGPGGAEHVLAAARAVVLATGTRATLPPIPGLAEAEAWDNRAATGARAVPRRLAVLGGGAVGAELAQAFRRLGSEEVTVVEGGPRLLAREEPFAGGEVRAAFESEGITVLTGRRAVSVRREGAPHGGGAPGPGSTPWAEPGGRPARAAGGPSRGPVVLGLDDAGSPDRIVADELLVAVGRTAASADLGLSAVGLPDHGFVEVDTRMRVTGVAGDWLYAVGDLNGRALLTHVAKYQARVAADVISGRADPAGRPAADRADPDVVPRVTFTDPQVSAVGRTERAAREAGLDVRAVAVPTASVAGSSVRGTDAVGTSQIVVDVARRVLVGATFVGHDTQEMVHAAAIAITGAVPLEDLWHAVPSFPTVSEVWLRLLEAYGL
ncbi:dihydrolipoyl dehydrogenase family protein [Parafrankia elaeagni]|uniref:dihydrolipoyl dehydrogenase family protein n=1 Tax=Parafrankia elaeagni TaxID=222534 RepID=UPI000376CAEF|nr:NAD(P)/FAD-dependent oxidoreductase [Parafrankia elaeagni]